MAGLATLGVLGACSENPVEASSAYVVHVADIKVIPATVAQCVTAYPQPVYFVLHMVNTTDSAVVVQRVSTVGIVTAASRAEDVGKRINTFTALPFMPEEVVLRPHDGDRNVTATMQVVCTGADVRGLVDIHTIVTVTTSAGQFNATPVVLRIAYPGAGGTIGNPAALRASAGT